MIHRTEDGLRRLENRCLQVPAGRSTNEPAGGPNATPDAFLHQTSFRHFSLTVQRGTRRPGSGPHRQGQFFKAEVPDHYAAGAGIASRASEDPPCKQK